LVISGIKSSGESFFWLGDDIIKDNNIEKGKWVQVEYQKTIPSGKTGKDAVLRLYFWQQDPKSEILLDDIIVKIYGKPVQ